MSRAAEGETWHVDERMRGNLLILCHCDERHMAAHAVLLVRFQGVGETSGHVILQLQKAHELAALRCTTVETAEQTRPEPKDSWIGTCLHFIHFHT